MKKSANGGNAWRNRYFILFNDATLAYYKDRGTAQQNQRVPRAYVTLNSDFVISESPVKENAFQVSDFVTAIYLAGSSTEEKKYWMHTMSSTIKKIDEVGRLSLRIPPPSAPLKELSTQGDPPKLPHRDMYNAPSHGRFDHIPKEEDPSRNSIRSYDTYRASLSTQSPQYSIASGTQSSVTRTEHPYGGPPPPPNLHPLRQSRPPPPPPPSQRSNASIDHTRLHAPPRKPPPLSSAMSGNCLLSSTVLLQTVLAASDDGSLGSNPPPLPFAEDRRSSKTQIARSLVERRSSKQYSSEEIGSIYSEDEVSHQASNQKTPSFKFDTGPSKGSNGFPPSFPTANRGDGQQGRLRQRCLTMMLIL